MHLSMLRNVIVVEFVFLGAPIMLLALIVKKKLLLILFLFYVKDVELVLQIVLQMLLL